MGWTGNVPIEVSNRNVQGAAVFIQDQTTEALDVPFLRSRVFSTVATQPAIDDRDIVLSAGHGAVIGDVIEIAEQDGSTFMQARALNVVSNTITLDQPMNHAYTVGSTSVVSDDDMLVNGVTTPQIFSILPLATQKGDMVRIIFEIRSTNPIDFSTFGGEQALLNGCVLRIKRENGEFKNLWNWKNNGDLVLRSFDNVIQDKAGGTEHGIVVRSTFGGQSRRGVVIRLDGSLGEELQIVIQDDLTLGAPGGSPTKNTLFRIVAQGHELQND